MFKKSGMDNYLKLDKNDYVARPLGIITNENSTGSVLELSTQGTLKTLLKNFILSPAMKTKVMWDIVKGMSYLHGEGFTHRGLNLESVLCYTNEDVACK